MRGYTANSSYQEAPLTWFLIAANFISLVLITFRILDPTPFVLLAPGVFARPWTLLTYPLLSFDIIGLLFYGLWLYYIGSVLESAWGTVNYAIFFLAVTLVSGISLEIGSMLTHTAIMADNWLPLSAVTLAFCLLMPDETIILLIFPIQARWLGWIEMAIVFFFYAQKSPLMGFFALAGCGVAWLWVNRNVAHYTGRGSWAGSSGAARHTFHMQDHRTWKEKINPVELWKRRQRRKQFDRLMRGDKK